MFSGGDERSEPENQTSILGGGIESKALAVKKDYWLNPELKYSPKKLDSSGYPGKVVYRRKVVVGAVDAAARSDGASAAPGLLNGHITSPSPFNPFDEGRIEVWQGAALIKVTKQGRHIIRPENEPDRKKRGRVQEFSRSSRRRMRLLLAKVRLEDGNLPLFGTTTYPDIFPDDAAKFKRDMETLIERLKHRFPFIGLVWRLEFKTRKSGTNVGKVAPHFHWMLWNVPRKFDFKPENGKWVKVANRSEGEWRITVRFFDGDKIVSVVEPASGQDRFTEWLSRNWYDVTGTGDLKHYHAGTNVKVLSCRREVFYYVSKYMGKVGAEMACPYPGRFWGVVNPKNIPMGKRVVVVCNGRQAAQLMRFMRRYVRSVTGRKYRFNRWSMSCVCGADFWAARLPELLGLAANEIPINSELLCEAFNPS